MEARLGADGCVRWNGGGECCCVPRTAQMCGCSDVRLGGMKIYKVAMRGSSYEGGDGIMAICTTTTGLAARGDPR